MTGNESLKEEITQLKIQIASYKSIVELHEGLRLINNKLLNYKGVK
tara:strand:- start:347 stop:484 length:138 start_codon:yes stop_codon:yes gene_type:complete